MPAEILGYPLLLVLSALVSIAAMLWLMINARALVQLFARPGNDLAAGPAPRGATASRRSVLIAILLFNLGWIGAVLAWSLAADRVDDGPPAGTPAPSMERAPAAEPQR